MCGVEPAVVVVAVDALSVYDGRSGVARSRDSSSSSIGELSDGVVRK
jgi:hypothetical protein